MASPRVILVPGMACDERVFEPQRAGGLRFEVAPLPMPLPRECMAAYALRIRDALKLDGPCVIGGVSFGGMIACELAHLADAKRVILVASCTSPKAIPFKYRLTEWISRLLPDSAIERRINADLRPSVTRHERITEAQRRILQQMVRDTGVTKLRRTARMILSWKAPPNCPCPMHAIHGDADRVIPLHRVRAEQVVPGAGHLLNITHAAEVNAFLTRYFE